MFNSSDENPPIPGYLRFVTGIECSVVFVAAVLLFFLPGLADQFWAWEIPPYNARFVGSVYIAAYIPLLIFWFNPRWTPGRLVLGMIFVFTGLTMVVMFLHWDRFEWGRPAAFLVFWPLYIFLPVNSLIVFIKLRPLKRLGTRDVSQPWRFVLQVTAMVAGFYGIGMLIAPESFAAFWPWKVDAFHGRIYASTFLTPAVGCWILSAGRETASEFFTLGTNLLAGGFFGITGTLLTSASLPVEAQVNYQSIGALAFFMALAIVGILGAALIFQAQRLKINKE